MLEASEQALQAHKPFGANHLIDHSDIEACSTYRFEQRIAEAGPVPFVGSVGDSYDNALAETITDCTRLK